MALPDTRVANSWWQRHEHVPLESRVDWGSRQLQHTRRPVAAPEEEEETDDEDDEADFLSSEAEAYR